MRISKSPNPDVTLPWQGDQWVPHFDPDLNFRIRLQRATELALSAERESSLTKYPSNGASSLTLSNGGALWYDERVRHLEDAVQQRAHVGDYHDDAY